MTSPDWSTELRLVLRVGASVVALRSGRYPGLGTLDASVTVAAGDRQSSLRLTRRLEGAPEGWSVGPLGILARPDGGVEVDLVTEALGWHLGVHLDGSGAETAERTWCGSPSRSRTVRGACTVEIVGGPSVTGEAHGVLRCSQGLLPRHDPRPDAVPSEVLPVRSRWRLDLLHAAGRTTVARAGGRRGLRGDLVLGGDGPPLDGASLRPRWRPGTRWPAAVELTTLDEDELQRSALPVEALALSCGLADPQVGWPLGAWRGEVDRREDWLLSDLDPADVHHLPVIAALEGPHGPALLELEAIGPHPSWGLEGFTSGAQGPAADVDAPSDARI